MKKFKVLVSEEIAKWYLIEADNEIIAMNTAMDLCDEGDDEKLLKITRDRVEVINCKEVLK